MAEPIETTSRDVADDGETLTPDVVDQVPSSAVEKAGSPDVHSAIERAAEAALAMPGVPGRDEFLSLAMQARILSMSDVAPKHLRGNAHVAFHIAMIGRDLGISVSAAIELIDVIGEGADARPSMSPQLLNAQIRRLGLGQVIPLERTFDHAIARALGPNGEILGDSEFTWEDAQIAGLVDPRCESARAHWKSTQGNERCRCRQGYRTYPKRMLWWRAAGFAGDDYFPEAGLGLYSPEELGAVVDEEGRPIDPGTVELPEGYQRQLTPAQLAEKTRGDGDELWDLQERIAALPEQIRGELRERWKQSERLGRVPPWALPVAAVAMAKSMVSGFERMARKSDGWTVEEARDEVRARVGPVVLGLMGCPVETDPPAPVDDPQAVDESVDNPPDPTVDAAGDTPPSTDAPPEAPETPADEPVAPQAPVPPPEPLLDVSGLPEGKEPNDDLVWLTKSPDGLIEEIADEIRTVPKEELDLRLKASGLPTKGTEDQKRARLAARLVRRRMEQLARP